MSNLTYDRLTNVVNTVKPYRKTKDTKDTRDRYPLDYRAHGYKCFFVEKDANGDNEYHIAYQHIFNEVEITKAEHDELVAKQIWGARSNGSGSYTKYVRDWHILGIVRKDNTIEFTTEYLHQGSRMFLSSVLGTYHSEVVSSVKHGGAIYKEFKDGGIVEGHPYWTKWVDTKIIPLFKGQRINLDTHTSVLDYEVRLPYVNRKRSKEVMAKYQEPLQVAETFFKTMTSDVFASEMQDVFKEVFNESEPWASYEAVGKVLDYAESQVDKDFYKYMYAVMLANRVLNSWSIGANNKYYTNHVHFPLTYFQAAKIKFIKALKVSNNAFDNKVYKANELYPSNARGVKVIVDGEQVRVY